MIYKDNGYLLVFDDNESGQLYLYDLLIKIFYYNSN